MERTRLANEDQNTATIRATYKEQRSGPRQFSSDSRPLPKNCSLRFKAQTNVKGHYDVYWEVVHLVMMLFKPDAFEEVFSQGI